MKPTDWITILSVLLIVAGWFVNSFLNRRHEIAKKRLDYRLDTLLAFIPVFFAIQENRANEATWAELSAVRTKFLLYCHGDEIDQLERLISAIETKDQIAFTDTVNDTIVLVRDRVRNELMLDKHHMIRKATGR